ncbi:RING-H2 finger protein ATL8-like [Typha latifolia]|uniref:RING-H2 finger protein ATL8-like n=1 Tax=Typha latifolia TaxID=4733 RepID=UPI003C30CF69
MATSFGVTSIPFVHAGPPTTAANNPFSYSELNTFITIATVFACILIAVVVLFAMSVYAYFHRHPRLTQQEPPASGDVIFDSVPWDEIFITAELAESGNRWRVEKIPVTVYSGDGESEICTICLEELAGGEGVKVMPRCRHTFHDGCIDGWLGVHSASCPVCRDVIAEKERRKDDMRIDIPMQDGQEQ